MTKVKALLTLLFFISFWSISAQTEIVVAGQVIDKTDKLGIGNVKVQFKNSSNYTFTDSAGFFSLHSNKTEKKIQFSILGYKPKELRVKKSQWLVVDLVEKATVLREFVVATDLHLSKDLMHELRKNKSTNNPQKDKNISIHGNEYTQAAISEIQRSTFTNKIFEDLRKGLILEKDSTFLLPVLNAQKTILIKGDEIQISNKKSESILVGQTQIAEELAAKLPSHINFYDEQIYAFGKNFLSPLAMRAGLLYKYHIRDSIQTPEGKSYIVSFQARNNKDLAFEGEMQIDSTSKALVQISASLPNTANINYLKSLAFEQSFKYKKGSWVFNSLQTTCYFQLINRENKQKNALFISKKIDYTVDLPANFDNKNRFSVAIDSMQNSQLMKNSAMLADLAINRYVHIGKFDWGPITQLASYNDVEGNKVTLGGRTGKKMWEHFTIGGSAAYAFGDEKWKFGTEMQYRFKKQDYALLALKYKDDVYQTDYDYHDEVLHEGTIGNGVAEILSAITQSFPEKCNRRQSIELSFDQQIKDGVNTHYAVQTTTFIPNEIVRFQDNTQTLNSFQDYRITIGIRFSHKERTMDEYFHRIYINNKYPIVHLIFEAGHYELSTRSDNYLKLHLLEKQKLMLGSIGKLYYSVEAGCLFGKVPYSLLEVYSGRKNYGLEKLNVELISLEHYASDLYLNLDGKFISSGLLLNRIPIIKQLNLREMLSAKIAFGDMHSKHEEVMQLPSFLKPMNAPYLILGAGVANVFKVMTIEYIMEMPEMDKPEEVFYGLRFKLFFDL